jgi:hypothetical protein
MAAMGAWLRLLRLVPRGAPAEAVHVLQHRRLHRTEWRVLQLCKRQMGKNTSERKTSPKCHTTLRIVLE